MDDASLRQACGLWFCFKVNFPRFEKIKVSVGHSVHLPVNSGLDILKCTIVTVKRPDGKVS